MMEERIKNIQSASASDPQHMTAPKELWLSGREQDLEGWINDRNDRRDELKNM